MATLDRKAAGTVRSAILLSSRGQSIASFLRIQLATDLSRNA